jgi:hypothetical protein
MLAALKYQSGRLPYLERKLRRDQPVGASPNAIGSKILAAHYTPRSVHIPAGVSHDPRAAILNAIGL